MTQTEHNLEQDLLTLVKGTYFEDFIRCQIEELSKYSDSKGSLDRPPLFETYAQMQERRSLYHNLNPYDPYRSHSSSERGTS